MPRRRIKSNKELLDFTIEKYAMYNKAFKESTGSDLVTRYHLKDILNDLLLIQKYASEVENGKGGEGW